MNGATRAFFSLPEVVDTARHRDHNAWHQLDHLPQNLALDGVAHGDRWVRTPACRAASTVDLDADLSAGQYLAMYWFREPAEQSMAQWRELGTTTLEQGRRPDLAWTRRRHTGFYRPLEGRVADRIPVSADAVPYRPHAGVVLEVLRTEDPGSVAAEEASRRHRADLAGALAHPKVVGTWTFGSRDRGQGGRAGATRIALLWCDADPCQVVEDLAEPLTGPALRTVLRTPLLTIEPGRWDWFDGG